MHQRLPVKRPEEQPLYERIATLLRSQIDNRLLQPGERAPSLRKLARQQSVSLTTVQKAYYVLESEGYLQARPRSGFFICSPGHAAVPLTPLPRVTPCDVLVGEKICEVFARLSDPDKVSLGEASLAPSLLPVDVLNRLTRGVLRQIPNHSSQYYVAEIGDTLRRQIARRAMSHGCSFEPQEITITSGAAEGINLCLRTVTRPGDTVVVESPTYFGLLQILESQGLKAIPFPSHSETGPDLDELSLLLQEHDVKACLVMTSGNNPLGCVMSNENKRRLVELCEHHDVPLIEDDVYGELEHASERSRSAKSFDSTGNVMYCSSFSKFLGPGYRVGWVQGGKRHSQVARFKTLATISSPNLPQAIMSEFMRIGGFERFLDRLKVRISQQTESLYQLVKGSFPKGTRVTRPRAGFVLWVELAGKMSGMELFRAAAARGISIMPGCLFSADDQFNNFVRLSAGHPVDRRIAKAVETLGDLQK